MIVFLRHREHRELPFSYAPAIHYTSPAPLLPLSPLLLQTPKANIQEIEAFIKRDVAHYRQEIETLLNEKNKHADALYAATSKGASAKRLSDEQLIALRYTKGTKAAVVVHSVEFEQCFTKIKNREELIEAKENLLSKLNIYLQSSGLMKDKLDLVFKKQLASQKGGLTEETRSLRRLLGIADTVPTTTTYEPPVTSQVGTGASASTPSSSTITAVKVTASGEPDRRFKPK